MEQMVRRGEAGRPAQKPWRPWRREKGNGRRRAQGKTVWGRQTGRAGKQNTPGPAQPLAGTSFCPNLTSVFVPESCLLLKSRTGRKPESCLSRESEGRGGRRCSHTDCSPSSPCGTLLAPRAVAPSFLSQGLGPFRGCTEVQSSAPGWEGGDPPSSRQRPAACPCSLPQMGSTA